MIRDQSFDAIHKVAGEIAELVRATETHCEAFHSINAVMKDQEASQGSPCHYPPGTYFGASDLKEAVRAASALVHQARAMREQVQAIAAGVGLKV